MDNPQTLIVGAGEHARKIAYLYDAPASSENVGNNSGNTPGLFWLSGFMSDMGSTKASALKPFAVDHGLGYTRFDYSGHGRSSGAFKDGTIGRWLEEARAVLTQVTRGPQIIIGSSMGGHIALLLLKALRAEDPHNASRIKALILIAPAWDMTEELMWNKFPQVIRDEIQSQGFYLRPSAYDAPYTITRGLIEDGRRHLLARQKFDPDCPVRIIQGAQDVDVPAGHTRELVDFLAGQDVQLIEVPDGEHRLSRPQDLALLFKMIEGVL